MEATRPDNSSSAIWVHFTKGSNKEISRTVSFMGAAGHGVASSTI